METQKYGVECGDVSQTMPMLAMYYYTMGMYTLTMSTTSSSSSSSASSITSSDGSSADEREDEQTSTHNTGNSGNSFLLESKVHATPHIDVR